MSSVYSKLTKEQKKKRRWYSINWYRNHIEDVKAYRQTTSGKFTSYKQNAKNNGLIFSISKEEFEKIINESCYYCNKTGYGIDRIDSKKGYIKENIVPCCSMCNFMKQEFNFNQFIEQCIDIANNFRNNG